MFRRISHAIIFYISVLILFTSCGGTSLANKSNDENESEKYDLEQILECGELIASTLQGPDSYYEYKGKIVGIQKDMAEAFANSIGTRLRIQTCRDTSELLQQLSSGEIDLIAYELPESHPIGNSLCFAGAWSTDTTNGKAIKKQWVIRKDATELAEAVNNWFTKDRKNVILKNEYNRRLINRTFQPTNAPFLDRKKGIISHYDKLYINYASHIGWDWRLLAAQSYQESGFDPHATSWVGARGLMQIMPSTAQSINIKAEELFSPDTNIKAGVLYIKQLNRTFSDIKGRVERIHFILAAYNGGAGHVRDAMTLARKNGKNPHSWQDVAPYILRLSQPEYYNDPDVQFGYMRGEETYNYVHSIIKRWETYRKVVSGGNKVTPKPAKRNTKKK